MYKRQALPESLEAVSRLFGDAQRWLGEFLESMRSEFPRFYFVGDDDLLGMLGGGIEGARPHLTKMFAALRDVSGGRMFSADGEDVPLQGTLDESSCVAWLSSLERAMRCSVAQSLKDALVIDNDLEKWLEAHPTQALCSSIQCDWASRMDAALDGGSLEGPSQVLVSRLAALSSATSSPLKRAQLIVELAQQRDLSLIHI